MKIDTTNTFQILALTLAGEIRQGSRQQIENVACCILKRKDLGYAPTIVRVCLQPKQFSCWNPYTVRSPIDANYTTMMQMAAKEPEAWALVQSVAKDALAGKLISRIGEADSYFNPAGTPGGKPYWAVPPAFETANDGLHHFWRVRYLNKIKH